MAEDDFTRRLTTIVAMDVAGYSRLMGADEAGTLARLKEHRGVIDPINAAHGGRIVGTAGDGLLLEFSSVVDAVTCAVAVQGAMAAGNEGLADDEKMLFRIGINLGDVLADGDDIFGDGVNIAARIEALAPPGGICISRTVRDSVRDRMDIALDDMGEIEVKNIARPVEVFRVLGEGETPSASVRVAAKVGSLKSPRAAMIGVAVAFLILVGAGWYVQDALTGGDSASTTEAQPAALSIVVLPFANRTGNPDNEYLADGITESLTTDLSRIQQAFIVNAATAFSYKGKPMVARQVGKELGVRFVLQGSVQRSGNIIRINAQLADAQNDAQLWAEVFEGEQADLFALQDQVTTRIGNSIGREMVILAARENETRTSAPKAVDLLLRARALNLKRHTLANFQQIEAEYRKVLALEPDNSKAMAGLAEALVMQASNYGSKLEKAVQEKKYVEAHGLALKVKELNPDIPGVYRVIAFYARAHDDFAGYKRASQTRYDLQPKNPGATISLAVTYLMSGEQRRAIELLTQANDLDPKHPLAVIPLNKCRAYIMLDEIDTAIEWCQKAVTINPRLFFNYLFLAIAHAVKGDDDKMRDAVVELRKRAPKFRLTHRPQPSSHPAYKEYFEKIHLPAARKAGLL